MALGLVSVSWRMINLLPEIPHGDRAVRSKWLGEVSAFAWLGKIGQGVMFAQGRSDTEVANREDIESTERKDQKHLGGPGTDSLDRGQVRDNRLIIPRVVVVQRCLARLDGIRQVQHVTRFDPRKPARPKLFFTQLENLFRCMRITAQGANPRVDGPRRFRRNLLTDYGTDQRTEAVGPKRELARANPLDPRGPCGADRAEVGNGLGPGIKYGGQIRLHWSRFGHKRFVGV